MTIKPASGKSGTKVTATVKGAKAYSTITTALIGASLDVRPAPTPMTDSIGNVTFEFTVPQMDAGVQNLEVAIGTTTASAAFVVDAPAAVVQVVAPTAPITVANALGTPLGADFVRAFYFNNATKAWSFNDPRPEFAAINTLKEVDGGKVYWVNVGNDKTITFCGRSVTFTKGWNQIAC
ncbi:MAG: hypothetical protein EXR54_10320 [Dehalococcoidia bacterium]|nr:hypothetical protein [Dehalococcoidia bacterium]